MKKQTTTALCALLCLLSLTVAAQQNKIPVNEPDYNKPRIFTDLPDKMIIRLADAQKLFSLAAGVSASVQLTDELFIKGVVVSNGESDGIKTVIIRAVNRNNAVFTFTRINKANGSMHFVGRIMSRDNGDALEIRKDENVYVLNKINLYDLISE